MKVVDFYLKYDRKITILELKTQILFIAGIFYHPLSVAVFFVFDFYGEAVSFNT